MTTNTYTIYTDGSCLNNGNPFAMGGYGAVLRRSDGVVLELAGKLPDDVVHTNVRAEMTAFVYALKALKDGAVATVYTDNDMLKKGCMEWLEGWKARGWRKAGNKPLENEDLWKAINEQLQRHTVDVHWVKGHSGHADNERADQLAAMGRQGANLRRVIQPEVTAA